MRHPSDTVLEILGSEMAGSGQADGEREAAMVLRQERATPVVPVDIGESCMATHHRKNRLSVGDGITQTGRRGALVPQTPAALAVLRIGADRDVAETHGLFEDELRTPARLPIQRTKKTKTRSGGHAGKASGVDPPATHARLRTGTLFHTRSTQWTR